LDRRGPRRQRRRRVPPLQQLPIALKKVPGPFRLDRTMSYLRPLVCALLLFTCPSIAFAQAKRGVIKLTAQALKIHRDPLLIDGHNDLPWHYRKRNDFSFRAFDIARPQPQLHTDIELLKKGGVGAQFWSAYVDAESKHAVRETLEQIDVIHRLVKA